MGRRRDRTSDLVEGLVKLVIFGAMFIAITVGGVKNFNKVFTSLMSAIILLVIGLIVVGGGLAFYLVLVKRRNRLDFEVREVSLPDLVAPTPAGLTEKDVSERLRKLESIPDPVASTPAQLTERTISERLRKLDWFQFEKITAIVLRARGYTVERRGGAKADGGIDLIARKDNETIAVQCKHWQAWNVGVRTTREFLGAMTHTQISQGMVVTMKGYTHEASDFAKNHNIELMSEVQYLDLIIASGAIYDPEFQKTLDDRTKYCPKCEAPMVLRRGYSDFWGCSRFPHCRYKLKAV